LTCTGAQTETFLSCINRIYPAEQRKFRYRNFDNPEIDWDKEEMLKELLNELKNCREKAALRQLSGEVKELLELNIIDSHNESPLSLDENDAKWYKEYYGRDIYGIAQMRCKSCGHRSLYEMVLWSSENGEAELFRIPGLIYEEALNDSVGLVVENGLIIGKLQYATGACERQETELIDIY
jgi:hypothetical protein